MTRRLKISLAVLGLLAAGGGVDLVNTARLRAHELLTNPIASRSLPSKTPADYRMLYQDVDVTAADGARLVGWYVPGDNGALVIAQHGYKSDRSEMLDEAAMLHRHGYGVLVPALRAHDLSQGDLITFGRLELPDLDAWYRYIDGRLAGDAHVGLLGNSFGGTLAIEYAAANEHIRAVAANSAFSSLNDTVADSVRFFTGLPPFPFAPLITFWAEREARFDVADVDATRVIGRLSPRPVLLMQGGADEAISRRSGERLYEAAHDPKELWFEPKVGHTGFDGALPQEYERRVVGFFDRYLVR